MALVESLTSIGIGEKMPEFTLSDPFGKAFNKEALKGPKGTCYIFSCNHCPYAIAIWPRLIELAHIAESQGIFFVAINPNIHPNYPDDAPEVMQTKIKEWQIPFPYLVDENQDVAKAYKAQCTPDIFLENANNELFYHGRLDDNWQNPEKVTKTELKEAITALANNQSPPSNQFPTMGCSIKWKD